MMPRLPRISGKEAVRKLKKLGFEVFDQRGSHVYLHVCPGLIAKVQAVGWALPTISFPIAECFRRAVPHTLI